MKYSFRGKNIEITDAMKEFAKHNLEKLNKYKQVKEDDTAQIEIASYKEKLIRVSIFIDIIGKDKILKASETGPDFYKNIDVCRKDLERQIKKIKDKYKKNNKEKFSNVLNEKLNKLEEEEIKE